MAPRIRALCLYCAVGADVDVDPITSENSTVMSSTRCMKLVILSSNQQDVSPHAYV